MELSLVETKTMVNPNGHNERLMKKIQSLKENNLTSKEREEVDVRAIKFSNAFICLAWTCGGLSYSDLASFSEDELKELDENYLSELIRKNRKFAWLLYLSNPLGWICGIVGLIRAYFCGDGHCGECHLHINYAIQKRYLKKTCRDNWFPAQKILKKVTPKST